MSQMKGKRKKSSLPKNEFLTTRFTGRKRRMTSSLRTDYTLIPNQRYRRSYRNSSKFSNTQDTDSSSQSTLGNFKTLPLEIFHIVLQYLPGLLLKRCTFLLPTKERLKYIQKIFAEVSCFKLNGCMDPLHCSGLLCYGVFLQTLTAGWDELECHRVYNFLCDISNLSRRVQTVVSSKPGSARKLELRIRIFCRNVLLNHWIHKGDSAFWLSRILKPWPMVNQARLLYIIFGPACTLDGHVIWHKMIDGPTDETNLKGLADAIKLLYDIEAKEWTADDVISLVDELSVVPREWLLENSARLLILCGNNICFTFMASKAVNGRAIELARLVVFLALVCEKDLYCMDWAVKMMQKVCKVFSSPGERNNFLQSVENTFAQIIMDALQSVISGKKHRSKIAHCFHLIFLKMSVCLDAASTCKCYLFSVIE
ncbi:F-box only protein 47 isoform X3 [Anolis carolinensis]|uniref:F-box only protein 47 isoform X3 n=1 Tax=Anolis carolinensis TaxID=28377 RepID=UPI002F2B79CD